MALREVQIVKDGEIEKLRINQTYLEECNEEVQVQMEAKKDELSKMRYRVEVGERELKRLEVKVAEA